MEIIPIKEDKEKYLPLLFLGDEQEELIRGYLDRGELFTLAENGEVLGVCVVTCEAPGEYELQNIAVLPSWQRRGLGRMLVEFVWNHYPTLRVLRLGTGDSPSTLRFYQALGFHETERERNYFLLAYDHPIYEDGQQLKDRVYFQKDKAR